MFCIEKSDVKEALQQIKNEQRFGSIEMLSKIFSNWTKDKLYTFITNHELKLKLYLKGHVFYESGDPNMRFYLLKEGQVSQDYLFNVESVSKVPLNDRKTEWNFKQEKR